MQTLRHSMNEWARNLASQNVSEEALVVLRRDRLCIPVKAGRQVIHPALQNEAAFANHAEWHVYMQCIVQLCSVLLACRSDSLPQLYCMSSLCIGDKSSV